MSMEAYRAERFRRALVHFIGGRAAQVAARAVLVLVLVRILPVADYGAYMLIVGASEMLLQVASFGILPLGQRYLPQLLGTLPIIRLYRFVGFLVVAQIAILAAIAYLLSTFWHVVAPFFGLSVQQTAATAVAAWIFLITPAFRFSAELLEALLEQGRAQIARALMVLGRAVTIGLLFALGFEVGLTQVLVIDMVITALCLLLAWFFIQRSLAALHSSAATGVVPVREMARFAWNMTFVGPLSAAGTPGAIRLVLANSLGVVETGLFAFLQSLERLISRYLPGTLLRGLVRPMLISRTVGQASTAVIEAGTGLLLKSNMLAIAAGLVVIAVCGDEIVLLMSGGKFADAGLTLLLLYVAMIVVSQRTVLEMVMQITGHARTLWTTALISPVALFLIWLFADYGLNVAVVIIFAGGLVANWIASGVLRASTSWFRFDWRGMGAIFMPAVAAAVLGFVLARWWSPIPAAGVALVFYILLVRVARPFKVAELDIVERVVGQRAATYFRGFAVG